MPRFLAADRLNYIIILSVIKKCYVQHTDKIIIPELSMHANKRTHAL